MSLCSRVVPALLCAAAAVACADSQPADDAPAAVVPAFVTAVERGGAPPPGPAADPAAWLIAHVDVETTGLVPGWHEMIDFGVMLTELDGVVRDSLFIRIQPAHPERLAPGAQAVNAFEAARWTELGAVAPAEAVDRIAAFHARAAAGRPVIMAAYNSHFDAAFLDQLFRGAGRSWRELYHYFILDVPSMAWALGIHDLTNGAVAARLGVEDEPRVAASHTGLTGARLNARIYRALVEQAPDRVDTIMP